MISRQLSKDEELTEAYEGRGNTQHSFLSAFLFDLSTIVDGAQSSGQLAPELLCSSDCILHV
jgi:hypothetical protein